MGLQNDEPTGQINDIDADQLLNDIEGGGNRDIPMSAGQEGAPETPTTPNTPAQTLSDLEFEAGGKPIKVPYSDPRVKQWASQGYDYAQKMAAFKAEQQGLAAQRQKYEQDYAPYKTIDEYAKQNPEWWAQVESAFQAKDTAKESGAEVPSWVKEKLDQATQFIDEFKSQKAEEQRKTEDKALDEEIQSIRKQYPNLDWDALDERGQSLEKRVLQHAIDSEIKSFRTAFRDYNHDSLLKLHEERGKEAVNKELQKRTKAGIIGESPTSKKGIQPAEGVKNKSYNDIEREIREELGIA